MLTPRTDAAMWSAPVNWSHSKEFVDADFARKLELELKESQEKCYGFRETVEQIDAVSGWDSRVHPEMVDHIAEMATDLATAQAAQRMAEAERDELRAGIDTLSKRSGFPIVEDRPQVLVTIGNKVERLEGRNLFLEKFTPKTNLGLIEQIADLRQALAGAREGLGLLEEEIKRLHGSDASIESMTKSNEQLLRAKALCAF